jgi:hypothetical protein
MLESAWAVHAFQRLLLDAAVGPGQAPQRRRDHNDKNQAEQGDEDPEQSRDFPRLLAPGMKGRLLHACAPRKQNSGQCRAGRGSHFVTPGRRFVIVGFGSSSSVLAGVADSGSS